ncbi:glutaminase A [Limosilactobacillus fastidiosus]|uniref:Glutaminase n=1 Tax=Limosilactobacillus fastidiosus TaxID=2759855 RepID=A0A7W3U030_9LACO|nr:glutaminase A [Limosilactobacillus fastidiosus]MBB1086456.1 glutaminase A [Limosilactobacillus fastidiosus]MCD7086336.1 glutaminase A [Limosilactobacillus fastidiosus]MCD7114883.1 glutaminase A [Limosilactobacillus fastidiosus]MCD7116899.1 glutaminase A [Limosilactobacillus fastidiosus]
MNLEQIVKNNLPNSQKGRVANYIPALGKVAPKQLGIVVYDLKKNNIEQAGDSRVRFAIESISKVITFLYAVNQLGMEYVTQHVGARQTGFPFNSILNLEIEGDHHPLNPFVNAGAIAVTSLVKATNSMQPFEQIIRFTRDICHDPQITLSTEISESEERTGDMDRSLAYYLKAKGMLKANVPLSLKTYFKQCSMMVTAADLANLGAVLANNGIKPWDNERLISSEAATYTKSLMMTTGLYNESGKYSAIIGVPTKSGVGGGLMTAVPNKYGIGIFSPPLDKSGNSIAGLSALNELSQKLKVDIFRY